MTPYTDVEYPPRTWSVPVTFTYTNVVDHPRPVRKVFGRGDWPHQNIIFIRDTTYSFINAKLNTAYMTLGLYQALIDYGGAQR